MSRIERRRLETFSRVKEQAISVAHAGRLLGLSERQARRVWKRYKRQGDAGLIHGLRGRACNASDTALQARVLAVYRQKYRGVGAGHAADILADDEKLLVSRKTLWRWLKREGLIEPSRRVKTHRRRRDRKACVGELVQMDGSQHAWFGPEVSNCVLFVMIDDASSRVWARFYQTEDTASAFDLLDGYIRRYGLPQALYVDKDSIYTVNDEKLAQNCRESGHKMPRTQFGRAMEELGIRIQLAHSPQAKGRVERVHGTLQDRLVTELRLAGIKNIVAANGYLDRVFLKRLNQLIGIAPLERADLHRRVPEALALADILCVKERRTVGLDGCVSFRGQLLQIDKPCTRMALGRRHVEVLVPRDGRLKLVYKGVKLIWSPAAVRPAKTVECKPKVVHSIPWRPRADHPWRAVQRACSTG